MQAHVKKYSFLEGGEWSHFPSKSEITITFQDNQFIVQWRETILEEFISGDILSIYHKSPSIGFKLKDSQRFQISLKSDSEFKSLVKCLNDKGLLQMDKITKKKSTHLVKTSLSRNSGKEPEIQLSKQQQQQSPPAQPHSQDPHSLQNSQSSTHLDDHSFPLTPPVVGTGVFVQPLSPVPSFAQEYNAPSASYYDQYRRHNTLQRDKHQQHYKSHGLQAHMRLNTFAQPIAPVSSLTYEPMFDEQFLSPQQLSQPQSSQIQPSQIQAQPTTTDLPLSSNELDFLSQILNEPLNDASHSSGAVDFNKMSDDEIKVLLREKIKDVKFLSFVERIECCLKDLR